MLSKDFKEFIASLNAHNVRYLIIGGYAVAIHGYPRYTKDLDVWVEATRGNLTKLLNALRAFGFGALQLKPEDFMAPDIVVQLGYPPNRIDIVTSPKDLDFMTCYAARVDIEVDGTRLTLIDLKSLRQNKAAVGRHQDLADLENLPPTSEKP